MVVMTSGNAGGERSGDATATPGHLHHHDHARAPRIGGQGRRALAPRFSLLRVSVATRLVGAGAVSALIWLGVHWALS